MFAFAGANDKHLNINKNKSKLPVHDMEREELYIL